MKGSERRGEGRGKDSEREKKRNILIIHGMITHANQKITPIRLKYIVLFSAIQIFYHIFPLSSIFLIIKY